ncbi:FemAB family PEP-CTERM system-associated protein [Candidatus Berkiella cookevillensis]|uniref:FemAB family PEP-CTERM system-associated protein n=1 Tax=Candidatus Berkiella cookevillensis TaxID=437022 RepID=A0A0Q9YJW4_9GAMM|nr:FemAB family XrtA/PEP-CTERM system-associated protein [Candidatus Berkiella cookevillensis]MCS5709134.1 FemAB family PEP-CTERM system-associated protein [Candidatus Berkiella cookevillensis]
MYFLEPQTTKQSSNTQSLNSGCVKQLTALDYKRWDDFVDAQGCHPYHRSDFKRIMETTFHFNTYYLFFEAENKIKAILPLVEMKSWLFGHALISTPFLVYGGPLGEEKARARLIEKAILLGEEKEVDYIDLRCQHKRIDIGWKQVLYVNFKRQLCLTHEENLQLVPRKQRAVIRKSEQCNLSHVFENSIDNFYNLYAQSLRNLGTPVLAKQYFQNLKTILQDKCSVLTVFHKNQAVSSVLSFYHQDTVFPYYGGGSPKARALGANDYLYHQLMKAATEQGLKQFDYGRSKIGTGSYRFKKHWGFEETPLHYTIIPISAKSPPNLNPTNPKYQFMIKTWRKLPLVVSNTIGPLIARRIG